MSKMNGTRNGCKDVFRAFLVKNATYDSNLEIPCLAREIKKPMKLVVFSKAMRSVNFDAWIHFYEDDVAMLVAKASSLQMELIDTRIDNQWAMAVFKPI